MRYTGLLILGPNKRYRFPILTSKALDCWEESLRLDRFISSVMPEMMGQLKPSERIKAVRLCEFSFLDGLLELADALRNRRPFFLALARIVCTEDTYARVARPTTADMWCEHAAALSQRKKLLAFWIRVRYPFHMFLAIGFAGVSRFLTELRRG